MEQLLSLRKALLTSMIKEIDNVVGYIDILQKSHEFYNKFKNILF